MSLNFEGQGSARAKIVDKTGKVKDQVVNLADPELHTVRHAYNSIDLEPNQVFQQIPDDSKERSILYITGASGSKKIILFIRIYPAIHQKVPEK